MKVICISGKMGSGKDTVALMMKEQLERKGERVCITHFADLLKYICKQYWGWDGNKDETGRNLLQTVGTDIIRRDNPDYWVNFVISILPYISGMYDYVVIPDCRFPNEFMKLRDKGYPTAIINIVRPHNENQWSKESRTHISETAMDGIRVDYEILNDGSKEDLYRKVETYHSLRNKS